jgi:hypothetical protein
MSETEHVPGCICVDPPKACDLHAAAPELLEALRTLADELYEHVRAGSVCSPTTDEALALADAAIAKAEGRGP